MTAESSNWGLQVEQRQTFTKQTKKQNDSKQALFLLLKLVSDWNQSIKLYIHPFKLGRIKIRLVRFPQEHIIFDSRITSA